MRIAVFSDIHSNNIAFEACIEYIKKIHIDGIIMLGDYVSDCPNPQKTLSQIKNLCQTYQTWLIRGNREEYFIDYHDGNTGKWKYSSYKGSLLYTYELLTSEDIEFFRNMPNTTVLSLPGTDSITLAHGSPSSARELLDMEKDNTKECLKYLKTRYLLCGHTHRQGAYEYKDKLLINPGSVGVAIGESATAHFALLEWHNHKWNYEFKSIPYDVRKLKMQFDQSTLMSKANIWPRCILKSVESGINYGPICAKAAYDMAIAHHETIHDYIVPEVYWEQAALDLDIIPSLKDSD